METYCEIQITAIPDLQESLIAELSQIGYDGFEEMADRMTAYIDSQHFDENELNIILNKYDVSYSKSVLNKQNWNQIWESNFEPVQVDDFVGVRADFHPPYINVQHELIITPKMSFGTGHHATTYLVMQLMRDLDFTHARVFDFGTGTGILAILAEKLGAARVLAVDNDEWCIRNAEENILVNHCKVIEIQHVDSFVENEIFSIVLANINRNIILDNFQVLRNSLTPNGRLVLSGLLVSDEAEITEAAAELGLTHLRTLEKNGWIAAEYFVK
jgi:ribosomal protein L11 methyltransferase